MKLFYFCSDFYPSNTGFAVAFHNFIKVVIDAGKFSKIYIFTTNINARIPNDLEGKIEIVPFSCRGELKIARCLNSKKALDAYAVIQYSKLKARLKKLLESEQDVFFYEEFYFGNLKKHLNSAFPENRHIIRVHGTMPEFVTFDKSNRYRRVFFEQALHSSLTIATTTKYYIKFINKYILREQYEKQKMVNYIVLPNVIYPISSVDETKQLEKKSHNTIKLIQLGRMDEGGYFQKGFDDTIKAMRYLEEIYDVKDKIEIVFIGAGSRLDYFLAEIKKLKYIRVKHFESLDNKDVMDLVCQSNAVLLPSRCEGMSMFAVEAINKYKPIITTNDTGVEDICINGFNSLTFDKYDYISFAEHVYSLIGDSERLRFLSINNSNVIENEMKKLKAGINLI